MADRCQYFTHSCFIMFFRKETVKHRDTDMHVQLTSCLLQSSQSNVLPQRGAAGSSASTVYNQSVWGGVGGGGSKLALNSGDLREMRLSSKLGKTGCLHDVTPSGCCSAVLIFPQWGINHLGDCSKSNM